MKKILVYICAICILALSSIAFVGCNNQDTTTPSTTTTYAITYNANGGTGTMEAEEAEGNFTLPINSFTAPAGKEFKCWLVGTQEKSSGARILVSADTEVKAVWRDIPPVTPLMLKVTYTQNVLDLGDTVDHTAVSIKCVYSDGTVENVNINDVTFWMETYEITDYIDNPIPYEGIYDITAKYKGLEATFRIACLADRDGNIVSLSEDNVNNINTITINFDKMLTEEDLYSIFSPSIENVGIRMDDDSLRLAYDEYGLVKGARITGTGAWIRFRQPNFKTNKYAIELTVDTSQMTDGEIIRFHGDEAVAWAGDFATIQKSNALQVVRYEFEANDLNRIVIKVYVNNELVTTETSTATVEDFLNGINNQCEGICWSVYDFGENHYSYSGNAIITSMFLQEIEK